MSDSHEPLRATQSMSWKQFVVRIIEALRWPAAFIAVAIIFREPVARLLAVLSGSV